MEVKEDLYVFCAVPSSETKKRRHNLSTIQWSGGLTCHSSEDHLLG